jgi:hypothetical protein
VHETVGTNLKHMLDRIRGKRSLLLGDPHWESVMEEPARHVNGGKRPEYRIFRLMEVEE